MNVSTGRWVSGEDFFNRDRELHILETLVRDRNHVLLTGQRRMGKTSIVQELGRRLENDGWIFLFADVEGAATVEDAIAEVAREVHPVRSIASRLALGMKRFFGDGIEEISAFEFGVKIRAGLNEGNWRRHGEQMFRACAEQGKPVLLVIDELPIFLKRMLRQDVGPRRVDEFLSWLRGVLQILGDEAPVLVVSGSIGLEPLVRQIGMSDRINHFYPFRLGPWDRDTSVSCFNRLVTRYRLSIDECVAPAVFNALGIGIPHQVQSFFARLRDFAIMHGRDPVTVKDVEDVYRNLLLGPSGQNDLVHYETRLKEALEDESYSIAMEILAEAAVEEVFTPDAKKCLVRMYSRLVNDASARIADVLEVLEHDGYLEANDDGHRFASRLLKDWWTTRFRDHHIPIRCRFTDDYSGE